jgi:hypothetical protein
MLLTKNEAKAIGSFINVAAGKTDAVASIQGVKVEISNNVLTFYSTNRMVIAKQSFPINEADVVAVFPPEILKFLKVATGSVVVEISDEGKAITAKAHDGRSIEAVAPAPSSYPKIEEYVQDDPTMGNRSTPINIDFDLLASVAKLVSVDDDKFTVNSYEFFIQEDNERGKPKPVIAKRHNIVAVIQPRLVK